MSDQVEYVCRKSAVAYVRSLIGAAIALLFWAILIGATFSFGYPKVAAIEAALCLLVMVKRVYNLFYLASVKWVVGVEELRISEGILPWVKSDFSHPYETIFEAYYNFGFFAKMFGYGTLNIRRTEGVTSGTSETHMRDPGKVTGLINAKIKELRKAQKQMNVTVAAAARSEVEELAALATLKTSGDISSEDYEIMKRRIIAGRSEGQSPPILLPDMSSRTSS